MRGRWLGLWAVLLVATYVACDGGKEDDDTADDDATADDDDATAGDDDDDATAGDDDDSATGPARGFVLIHCDPHEILNLHENLVAPQNDHDGDEVAEPEDSWKGLMDLVDLADEFDIPLTLQFSVPYVDYMAEDDCDELLTGGRVYPAQGGLEYHACVDLVLAWELYGHELSIHHHGPEHDPLKFDGFTNREIWDTNGQRPCLDDGGVTCSCPLGNCPLCTTTLSELFCTENVDSPGLIGSDPEWRGGIDGALGLMGILETTLGDGTFRSVCSNHGDEAVDLPWDDAIEFTTQGGNFINDRADFPRCVGYDYLVQYHEAPKYTWFYHHNLFTTRDQMADIEAFVATVDTTDDVLGVVFHVQDFVKSERPDNRQDSALLYRDLFNLLRDPNVDGSHDDYIPMGTLVGAIEDAGKTEAPDPCVESCFGLDPDAETSQYTIPLDPPGWCD